MEQTFAADGVNFRAAWDLRYGPNSELPTEVAACLKRTEALEQEVFVHGMNVRVQIQAGKIEGAAPLLREEIMPTAANYPGFIQNFLIVDAPTSRLDTLSVWESEADAKAIYEDEGGLYQMGIAKLQPMLAAPPEAWMGPLTRVDR